MDRRSAVPVLAVVVVVVMASFALTLVWSPISSPSEPDQTYPAGADADHINFSALKSDDTNVTHTPRGHWDSYAIASTAPPERQLVEGDYYINSATGEIIADRWDDLTVYRNGTTYAFTQPAESIPNEREQGELESDDAVVYDNATDAYYRYDPHYGQLAPTNIGQHTTLLESYTWEAANRTTHHGVPVVTYQVTGKQNSSRGPPAINGTLRLGVEDGIIYGYDITLDTGERHDQYTYRVKPTPFPDHGWVHTAREVATGNGANSSS